MRDDLWAGKQKAGNGDNDVRYWHMSCGARGYIGRTGNKKTQAKVQGIRQEQTLFTERLFSQKHRTMYSCLKRHQAFWPQLRSRQR